ncbi:hypothetical protein FBU30_007448 [Linnemannia zychae]|nr:hypothetical protein FBU30_007448 [Linnemannia zychae]
MRTCHKFSPSGGVGATNAIHDAFAVANRVYGLPFHPTIGEIDNAFKEYKKERFEWVMNGFTSSKIHRTLAGQSFSAKITLQILKHIPSWLKRRAECKQFCHRPQAAFLPLVEDTGRFPPAYQPSLHVKAPQESEKAVEL